MSDQSLEASQTSETEQPEPARLSSGGAIARSEVGQAPAPEPRTGEVLPPKRRKRGFVLPLMLLAALGFGGWRGYDWFETGRFIVSTDDAYVKADTSAIAAKLSGYISAVPVADNMRVKADDVLVRIDDGDYKLAVQTARDRINTQDATIARLDQQVQAQSASIDQAKAQVISAKADATRAAAELDRTQKLVQSSYGTQQRLEQAQADRDRTAALLSSAQASVAAAEASLGVLNAQKVEAQRTRNEFQTALEKAQRDLSFAVVRAPFDGVVGNKAAQPGLYVQPGTRLLALVPLDSAYVEANFKETQLGSLKPGQKATVTVDAYSGRTIEATVDSVAPASGAQYSLLPPENATGNFTKIVQRVPVRLRVPPEVAQEGILRPGLSVVVSVHTRDDSEPKPSLMSALGLSALGLSGASR